tara:strand:- start:2788 stop:3912 length:1125 start_codon:yes stop_codon:yes gene_type:complete
MKIGVLTSSRADFGIYHPLLVKMVNDDFFKISLIVFGMHMSKKHGLTYKEIESYGYDIKHKLNIKMEGDSPFHISTLVGDINNQFSLFWKNNKNKFDLVFCLGDRFEMFAAVISGLPFGIKYVHFHGGETTLGAIDDVYRNSISLASKFHFTATSNFSKRLNFLLNKKNNIYNIGSLSLDNIKTFKTLSIAELKSLYNIDFDNKTILVTIHPETVDYLNINKHSKIIIDTLKTISKDFQIIITLPNADTFGSIVRSLFISELKNYKSIFLLENLGKLGYFSALKYCSMLIGNSSSGVIEAASFNKYVINVGKRQDGRVKSDNTFDVPFNKELILNKIEYIKENKYFYSGKNKYYKKNSVNKVISILKKNNERGY